MPGSLKIASAASFAVLLLFQARAFEDSAAGFTNSIGMKMLRIPAGSFRMGSDLPTDPEQLKQSKARLDPLERVRHQLEELDVMLELVAEDDTPAHVAEAAALSERVEAAMAELAFRIMLDGEYDARSAFLSVQAGAGGTDSQDWAEMLLRMYLRWCDKRGFNRDITDI